MIKHRFSQCLLLLSFLLVLVFGISACGGGGGGNDPDPQPQPQPTPAEESPLVSVGSNVALNTLSTNFSMKVVLGPSFAGETTSNSYRMISSISIN